MTTLILLPLLGVLILYLGLYKAQKSLLSVTVLGLLGALTTTIMEYSSPASPSFGGMFVFDPYAIVFSALFIIITLLVILLSKNYFDNINAPIAEYYALILFSLTGMIMMVASNNFSLFFIGVETMSVSLYILAGISKKDIRSNEASLKYFLMGAFSTGILLMGIALVYGATASFDFFSIGNYVTITQGSISPMLHVGLVFLMIALAFKVGAAPFHFWAPDVYDGSPSLITAFMSTGVKIAGFASFLRIFTSCFSSIDYFWAPIIFAIIILSLFIGNITALYQKSFKRLLAYSSISHAGYMLLAILAVGAQSKNAILLYGTSYAFASIIAFAVLIALTKHIGNDKIESFNGLAKTNPFLAFALTLAMLSFAGIPLTAGFVGKFLMFNLAIEKYQIMIIVLAILNAVIGVYYYFKLIVAMYFQEPMEISNTSKITLNFNYILVITIAAVAILFLGLFPNTILGLI